MVSEPFGFYRLRRVDAMFSVPLFELPFYLSTFLVALEKPSSNYIS
ncbi:hypothetical protein VCR4J5_1660027 [Vibrio crassostreae]|uniref:Uncharacterized protein n=1 Tax=Vibrio crassostreae TaxID=246167 RepID=A0ABP1WS08_9VIBR|nr:hypothetical protein VCR19J5_1240027 [Vibrio crassostreae]CDT21825.1 hypothetical protein VCR4J5_1660027 [Vibrio crassostreae]